MRDSIQQADTMCKHPQYIHDAAKKYHEVFNQIFEYVEKIVKVTKFTAISSKKKETCYLYESMRVMPICTNDSLFYYRNYNFIVPVLLRLY